MEDYITLCGGLRWSPEKLSVETDGKNKPLLEFKEEEKLRIIVKAEKDTATGRIKYDHSLNEIEACWNAGNDIFVEYEDITFNLESISPAVYSYIDTEFFLHILYQVSGYDGVEYTLDLSGKPDLYFESIYKDGNSYTFVDNNSNKSTMIFPELIGRSRVVRQSKVCKYSYDEAYQLYKDWSEGFDIYMILDKLDRQIVEFETIQESGKKLVWDNIDDMDGIRGIFSPVVKLGKYDSDPEHILSGMDTIVMPYLNAKYNIDFYGQGVGTVRVDLVGNEETKDFNLEVKVNLGCLIQKGWIEDVEENSANWTRTIEF